MEEYKKNGCVVAKGKKVGKMFTLDVKVPEIKTTMFAQGVRVIADIEICHKCIGQVDERRLIIMKNYDIVEGLPNLKVNGMEKVCEACQFGKLAKSAFPHDKRKNILDVVHFDVWGLSKTKSMGKCIYYVTFIDDHTRKVWVYFIKQNSEVVTHF